MARLNQFFTKFTNFFQKLATFLKMLYNRIRIVVIKMKKVYITVFIAIAIILFAPLKVKAAKNVYGSGLIIKIDGAQALPTAQPHYLQVDSKTWKYTGKQIEPKVEILSGSTPLALNVHYTVEYNSVANTDPGWGIVTIRGKENNGYTGFVYVKFQIVEESSNSNFDFDADGYNPTQRPITTTEIKKKAGTVVAIIRNIGMVISVIALMIIGFKQMTASIEEKSILKQAMPGYIIGVILVAGITFLPTIIYQFAKGLW